MLRKWCDGRSERLGGVYMKNGIKYFPFSSSLEQKYKFIKAQFGLKGLAIVVLVLQQIYGDEGYYCEWSQDVALLFADENSVGYNVVSEVIEEALRRGIFDLGLYGEYGVLSSVEIQENFFEATRRRKNLKIKKEYLLVDYTQISENVDIFTENADIFSKNDDIFEQRRGEENTVFRRYRRPFQKENVSQEGGRDV